MRRQGYSNQRMQDSQDEELERKHDVFHEAESVVFLVQ